MDRILQTTKVVMLFAVVLTLLTSQAPLVRSQEGATSPQMDAVAVVGRVASAVVTVLSKQAEQEPLGASQPHGTGHGTGFIIDEQGHVVTNEHVVRDGDQLRVILADGQRRPATLVGKDPLTDLAVVRMAGRVPATLTFGDSDALQVGQPVLAIGSPLGQFTNTVTSGIVSALHRDVPGQETQGMAAYSNLIQHDAPINHGNSGGPLIDANGQVIGVNTLGIPQMQGIPVQGIFFAIPSNTVLPIVNQLLANGHVDHADLGVTIQPITRHAATQHNLPVDHGVYVVTVAPNGPAARAGIEVGDIITDLGGQRIDQQNAFAKVLLAHEAGEQVPVTIVRGDEEQQLEVTLAERPQE